MSFPGASPPGTPASSGSEDGTAGYDDDFDVPISVPTVAVTKNNNEEGSDEARGSGNNDEARGSGNNDEAPAYHHAIRTESRESSGASSYSSGSSGSSRGSSRSSGGSSYYTDSNYNEPHGQPGQFVDEAYHPNASTAVHNNNTNGNNNTQPPPSRMSKRSDSIVSMPDKPPASHWDILNAAIEKGGTNKVQVELIQRAQKFTHMAEPLEFDYPQVNIPIDLLLPSFTNLSHPNRQHIRGHLNSHKEIVENAVSRIDTQPPKALHWCVRKTVQRLRDPLPSLAIPNTLKNHMASSTLDHIKRQHHFHDDLIGKVKARVDTHHTRHHVRSHMKRERMRKKVGHAAAYRSQLRAERKRRVTGTGAGSNRGWMLKSEQQRPMQLKSRGAAKRDPRMMEEPFIGGLNHLARMNGLFHWPTKGSGQTMHIATLNEKGVHGGQGIGYEVGERDEDEDEDEDDERRVEGNRRPSSRRSASRGSNNSSYSSGSSSSSGSSGSGSSGSSRGSSRNSSRSSSVNSRGMESSMSRESRDHFPVDDSDVFPYRPISR